MLQLRCRCSRAGARHPLQEHHHRARSLRADYFFYIGRGLVKQQSIRTGHPADVVRFNADAIVGKHAVGGHLLKQRHLGGANRNRQICRYVLCHAKPVRRFDYLVDAHPLRQLQRGNIA